MPANLAGDLYLPGIALWQLLQGAAVHCQPLQVLCDQPSKKTPPVLVVFEDGLSAVAAAHDVVNGARELDPILPGHGGRRKCGGEGRAQEYSPDPNGANLRPISDAFLLLLLLLILLVRCLRQKEQEQDYEQEQEAVPP